MSAHTPPEGYRLLERPSDAPHPDAWVAARERDGRCCLLLVSDACRADAPARDALLARLHVLSDLPHEQPRLRLPVYAAPHGPLGVVVELDSPRLELGQRGALQAAQALGFDLQRAPQEAARLTLALVRALARVTDAPHPAHFNSDRVLLGADGRLRFDPVSLDPPDLDVLGSVATTFAEHPPEHIEALAPREASYVFFAGLMLYRFGAGCPARTPHYTSPSLLYDVATNVLHRDTARLYSAAPGLGAVAARATHRELSRRYSDLRALELDLHARAAAIEDTFPHPNVPAPSSPAQLLEALRESLNAGHLSAALAHLDTVASDIYDHPAVRDYVRLHVERARLDRAITAACSGRDAPRKPLDWAAFHLAAQHPDARRSARAALAQHPAHPPAQRRGLYFKRWIAGLLAAPHPPRDAP